MRALDIANWFIARANSEKLDGAISEGISNLKLQKMLYFAQAAHLALFNKSPLFTEDIYAWDFGPVVKTVYGKFKGYGNKPIGKPTSESFKSIDSTTVDFLNNIWAIFGKFSAAKLVQMSHDHQPWKDAVKSQDKLISKKSIYDYYKTAFQKV